MSKIQSISVLIPNYNRAGLIGRVIEAARAQTRPPDEIIVVDDRSTDNSVEVLRASGVKLICHADNAGPAVARNNAAAASSGELLVFVDADAVAAPGMIEALCRVYESAPDPDRLGGVGGRGVEQFTEGLANRWRCAHARQDHGPRARGEVEYLYGLCCSFTRAAFQKVGGFDPFYRINAGEDLDIGLRLRRAGYRLAYTPEAIVCHQHSDTLENLARVQRNWSYWNCVTRMRNQEGLGKVYLGAARRLVGDTLADLFVRRDFALAMVNFDVFRAKARGIAAACAAQPEIKVSSQ